MRRSFVSPATRALPIFLWGFVKRIHESLKHTYALSCKVWFFIKFPEVQQRFTHHECQEIWTRGRQLVLKGETSGIKDTQNMPTKGMRYKSILRVALWRTFGSAARFCSLSPSGKLILEVFSLLREGLGERPVPIEVSMRNNQGDKSGWKGIISHQTNFNTIHPCPT